MRKLVAIITLFITFSGFCCDCSMPSTKDNFYDNDVVVTAEVLEINKIRKTRDGNYKVKVKFKLIEKYKGLINESFSIITGNGYGDCGMFFEVGEQYLVFASKSSLYNHESKLELITTKCTRSGLIEERKKELVVIKNLS